MLKHRIFTSKKKTEKANYKAEEFRGKSLNVCLLGKKQRDSYQAKRDEENEKKKKPRNVESVKKKKRISILRNS